MRASLSAILLLLACVGLTHAVLTPPVALPGTQNIKTQIKASKTGAAIVAWVENNQVFASILDVDDLAQGQFGTPVQLSQAPLNMDDDDEAIHVNMSPQGSTAWVIWTRPKVNGSQVECQVEGRMFDGINQVWKDTKKIKVHVDDGKGACSIPGTTSIIRADGQEAFVLLFAPEVQSVFDGDLELWHWDSKKWDGQVLCCQNPTYYVSSVDGHYTIMADDQFEEIYVAWVTSNNQNYKIDAQRRIKGSWIIENEIILSNDAQIASSFANEVGLLTINLGSQVDIMTWSFGKSFKYTPKVIVAPQTTNILAAYSSLADEGDIVTTVMAFDPSSQTSVYVCQSSFLKPLCNVFNDPAAIALYSNDAGSQNQLALISDGGVYGAIFARSLPAGNTTAPGAVLPEIGGAFGFISYPSRVDIATIFESNASLPLCETSLSGTVPSTRGEVVVIFSNKFCNDGCSSCFTPTYTAYATVHSMPISTKNSGYICSPQLKCVKASLFNAVSKFPSSESCDDACEDSFLAVGYTCSSSGKCVASKEGAFPTMDQCSAACVPLPSSHSKMSGGGVFLLIFFLGFVFPYFIIGTLYNKFSKGASGFEAIPNYDFWSELPGLVRDGFAYCSSCGQKTSGSTYQQI